MSARLRIALWITVIMLIMAVIIIAFVIIMDNSSISSDPSDALIEVVTKNASHIECIDGSFSWSNVDFYNRGIFCSIYTPDGTELVGVYPTDENFILDFKSGIIRSFDFDRDIYYVFDLFVDIASGGVWVRGIAPAASSSGIMKTIVRLTYTLLPMLLIFSIGGGWLVATSAFRPVEKIVDSADSIGSGDDLSARIDLQKGPSEMRRIANSFDGMFARLERSFDSEKQFTSAASHELRTPITVILAECDRAKRKCVTREDFLDTIDTIEDQGKRMSSLVHQLLNLSRLQYREAKYPLRVAPFSEFIEACVEEYTPNTERGITLTTLISPSITARYNPELFSSVVNNLLQNANKYGHDNGHTVLALRSDFSSKTVILSVSDDGIGISPENIGKIWSSFWQADPSRGIGGGAGLGLSLVKEVVSLHGGTVSVESELNVGSIFTIRLPMV